MGAFKQWKYSAVTFLVLAVLVTGWGQPSEASCEANPADPTIFYCTGEIDEGIDVAELRDRAGAESVTVYVQDGAVVRNAADSDVLIDDVYGDRVVIEEGAIVESRRDGEIAHGIIAEGSGSTLENRGIIDVVGTGTLDPEWDDIGKLPAIGMSAGGMGHTIANHEAAVVKAEGEWAVGLAVVNAQPPGLDLIPGAPTNEVANHGTVQVKGDNAIGIVVTDLLDESGDDPFGEEPHAVVSNAGLIDVGGGSDVTGIAVRADQTSVANAGTLNVKGDDGAAGIRAEGDALIIWHVSDAVEGQQPAIEVSVQRGDAYGIWLDGSSLNVISDGSIRVLSGAPDVTPSTGTPLMATGDEDDQVWGVRMHGDGGWNTGFLADEGFIDVTAREPGSNAYGVGISYSGDGGGYFINRGTIDVRGETATGVALWVDEDDDAGAGERSLTNGGVILVNVDAAVPLPPGAGQTSVGIHANGTGLKVANHLGLEPDAKGEIRTWAWEQSAGIRIEGAENEATHIGDLWVKAGKTGRTEDDGDDSVPPIAMATGMLAIGDGHILRTHPYPRTGGFDIEVGAKGWDARATGIGVEGTNSKVVQRGSLQAKAEGMNDPDGDGPPQIQAIGIRAEAPSDVPAPADAEEGGLGHVVTNVGNVVAMGDHASGIAFGIWLQGDDNTATNSGRISSSVWATGDDESYAAGIVAEGNRNYIEHIRDGSDEEYGWEHAIYASASGDGDSVGGIIVSGSNNTILSAGRIRAEASGSAAAAVGISVTETGGVRSLVVNAAQGDIKATALGGEGGFAVGVHLEAHADDSGSPGVVEFHNEGHINALAASEDGTYAIGVMIGAPEDPWDNGDGNASADEPAESLGAITVRNLVGGVISAEAPSGGSAASIKVHDDPESGAMYESVRVINDGTLIGDVVLGSGDDHLVLWGSSETYGDVSLGGGVNVAEVFAGAVLTGVLDGGDGDDDPTGGHSSLILSAVEGNEGAHSVLAVRNFSDMKMVGGNWTFTADSAFEEVDLASGHLAVDGDSRLIIGNLSMTDGAILSGTGTIRGDVHNEGGTVAPGASIGWLTIEGTYQHDSSSTFNLEIDPRETDPTKRSDRLIVKVDPADPVDTGIAELDGGTVQVTVLGGAVKAQDEYIFLQAENDIVGTFDGVDPAVRSVFLRYALLYRDVSDPADPMAKEVVLTVQRKRFDSVAKTANQRAIASALDDILDRLAPDDTGDMAQVLSNIQNYMDADEAPRAFDQMTGEIYTTYPVVGAVGMHRFAQAVSRGLADPVAQEGRQAWFSGYGTFGNLKGGSETASADFHVVGGAAGINFIAGPKGRAGVTAGFAHTSVDMPDRKSKMDGDGYQLGFYGQYDVGTVRMTGMLAHGRTNYDSRRKVEFLKGTAGHVNRSATGRFNGSHLLVSVRGEVLTSRGDGMVIEPVFGLAWLNMTRDGFSEEGAGDLGLTVDGYDASYLRGDIGVRVAMQPSTTRGGWMIKPAVRAAWVHDFSSPSRDTTVRLRGGLDDPRTIRGIKPAKGGFQVGLSLDAAQADGGRFGWNLEYDGEFRSDVQTHSIHAGLSFRF